MKRSLPVLAGLGAASAFLPRAWMGAWGALLLAFVLMAAPAFADHLPDKSKDFAAAGWMVATAVVGLVAQGALYRIGVTASPAEARKLGLGLGGLQFGLPELRLLGASVFVSVFLALIAGAFVLVLAFVLTAERAGLPSLCEVVSGVRKGQGWAIWLAVIGLIAAWTLVQVSVRVSLFKPATVARGRLVSVDALALSHGAFWPLFMGLVVVLAPVALLGAWQHGLFGPGMVMPISSKAYAVARAAFLSLVELPFGIGFLSYAYNRLEYRPKG